MLWYEWVVEPKRITNHDLVGFWLACWPLRSSLKFSKQGNQSTHERPTSQAHARKAGTCHCNECTAGSLQTRHSLRRETHVKCSTKWWLKVCLCLSHIVAPTAHTHVCDATTAQSSPRSRSPHPRMRRDYPQSPPLTHTHRMSRAPWSPTDWQKGAGGVNRVWEAAWGGAGLGMGCTWARADRMCLDW